MTRWDPTPCYSQSQVISVCQSFRPVAQFFFPQQSIFSMEKGCDHIDMFKTFPGDTDCKIHIYIWVCGLQLFKNEPDDARKDRLFVLYSTDITCRSIAAHDLFTHLSF